MAASGLRLKLPSVPSTRPQVPTKTALPMRGARSAISCWNAAALPEGSNSMCQHTALPFTSDVLCKPSDVY